MATSDRHALENYEAYVYGRDNGHLDFIRRSVRCEKVAYGDQWEAAHRARMRAHRRPALDMNMVLPSLAAMYGEQLRNRIDVGFSPLSGGNPKTAVILNKLNMQTSAQVHLKHVDSQVFEDGMIRGRGFWDSRISYGNNIYGEVDVWCEHPHNVILDPDANQYDPEEWNEVTKSRWLSIDEIELEYGEDVRRALEGRPSSDLPMGYDFIDHHRPSFALDERRYPTNEQPHRRIYRALSRQFRRLMRRDHIVINATGDLWMIPPNWERNDVSQVLRMFPQFGLAEDVKTKVIWWSTSIDSLSVKYEESPYRSFTITPYFPFFFHGRTLGLVENQIGPQQLYNSTKSAELHIISSVANGGWKLKKNSLHNMTTEELRVRGAETGLVLELDNVQDAEKIQPNQVPTGFERISFTAQQDIQRTSMVSESMRGFDRADVAARAIEAKRQQSSNNFASPLDKFVFSKTLLAERFLELWQGFYTNERVITYTRGDAQRSGGVEHINQVQEDGTLINDISIGRYQVVATVQADHDTWQDLQFEEAKAMKELGLQVPDHVLYRTSHIENKEEIIDEITSANDETAQRLAVLEEQKLQAELDLLRTQRKQAESDAVLNMAKAQNATESDEGEDDLIQMLEIESRLAGVKYEADTRAETEEKKIAAQLQIAKMQPKTPPSKSSGKK